jgi:flagellar protein FlbD
MIELHRLGRDTAPFHLNPDLIVSVEANPDTVVHLTNGTNLVVNECVEEVVALIRSWRRSIFPVTSVPPSRIPS